MRAKDELLSEFGKEGDDVTFLEVFVDLRDLLERVCKILEALVGKP